MKKHTKSIKQLLRGGTVLLFFVVVLLSSCSLRKPVQHFLDLSVAKQLNVGKSTFNTVASCYDYSEKVALTKSGHSKTKIVLSLPFISPNELNYRSREGEDILLNGHNKSGWPAMTKIPGYILFKKLRLHL
ncbi:hypothetical protein [Zhouia amylolytica]|uniref:hypothetical protein n=1 Tax=Zhouia amylolytica TaxID=376730 RepID=UPI0020CE20D4|nr:hypothetical protein [Zhouia amylolytica]MCQ0112088.1 hypothetical protein [Zhouia amylolytica]